MTTNDPALELATMTRPLTGLLGTDGAVSVTTRGSAPSCATAIDSIVATIIRLEAVFSSFNPASDLVRFRSGAPGPFAAELTPVLDLARRWQDRSNGAFNPHAGVIIERWVQAAERGDEPSDTELAALVANLDVLPYERSPHLNLNALAKGWIIDEVVQVAFEADSELVSVWLNLGGDIVHRGLGTVDVGIEDPRTPWDNAPPLATVTISEQAIASSGVRRRPLRLGDRRINHVFDPRSGWPVTEVVGSTVVADSAADADVVATILCVLSAPERTDFVAKLPSTTAWLVVPLTGSPLRSSNFPGRLTRP